MRHAIFACTSTHNSPLTTILTVISEIYGVVVLAEQYESEGEIRVYTVVETTSLMVVDPAIVENNLNDDCSFDDKYWSIFLANNLLFYTCQTFIFFGHAILFNI
ncbi:hypothetical protein AtNW77_Chr1g0072391 [Arabidopsis thaliana]|uniref:Uncharacterized protein n=1 Tax=Arabidopsis thaliana x Arabidopsis arenosa TaxID=1240361 RepID=A0A8T2GW47_9BRAS|nr:hypothetical protein ISN45_At01g061830 [Arabidopsis thaliana x Arabidopsis arenosa]